MPHDVLDLEFGSVSYVWECDESELILLLSICWPVHIFNTYLRTVHTNTQRCQCQSWKRKCYELERHNTVRLQSVQKVVLNMLCFLCSCERDQAKRIDSRDEIYWAESVFSCSDAMHDEKWDLSKWELARCLLTVWRKYTRMRIRSISRDLVWRSNPFLLRFDFDRNNRAEEECRNFIRIFWRCEFGVCFGLVVFFFLFELVAHHTSCVAICPHVVAMLCSGVLLVSCEQTRTVLRSAMQLETCPVDVAVQSSTRVPVLVPEETAQNIVEITTAPEQLICSGDGTCRIQSSIAGD